MAFPPFNHKTLRDFNKAADALGLQFPASRDLSCLINPVPLGTKKAKNRLVILPVEGCDAAPDGSPSALTSRRYRRYARGGAGVIWLEAVAVSHRARGHGRMLHLHKGNLESYGKLVREIREAAQASRNPEPPYLILQLHYSGRFGRFGETLRQDPPPGDRTAKPERVLDDRRLREIQREFLETALMAEKAGFDGVDIKCCHGYLLAESLTAHTRPGSYGGSYEGRTRLVREILQDVKLQTSLDVAVRMDTYTRTPFSCGWGTDRDGNLDLTEPVRLARDLVKQGVKIIGISAGVPFIAPHLSRPYNAAGVPPEDPLRSIHRLIRIAGVLQAAVPGAAVVGAGYSGLRNLAPFVAAGAVTSGEASLIGFGRQALAYPSFPDDLARLGGFHEGTLCLCCDGCIGRIESAEPVKCILRD